MTPAEILKARHTAGLSQSAAAALVHLGSGMRWSEYERGTRNIDPARWELFLLLTDQHPRLSVIAKPHGNPFIEDKPGARHSDPVSRP